ncbi:hypothetical protein CASFOL_029701 [Castilleja foliolosa]|uniref:Protein kinase domain-containing protein n=1 Tax=Castilleja foliolosa TaxID=1961234 RepID=A0ABD3C9A4_9LAMI
MKRDDHHLVVQEKTLNKQGDGVSWIRGPLLGRGTYGRVHKATLRRIDKHVSFPFEMAVKSAEISVSGTLSVEKEIMNNLKGCPYIIQCFGDETTMGYDGDLAYNILLEYASGGSLSERIKKSSGGKGLSEREVKAYTRSILRGLKHIHDMGYVHCDLKPSNILLVKNDIVGEFRAKIGDFGLAKKRESSLSYPRGTTMYLSPEAVIDGVQEGPSDVWALGCTVLEMLTGQRPWKGEEDLIRTSIMSENELPPEINSKEISEDARDFVMRCLERKVTRRWTVESLLRHTFLDDLGNDDVREPDHSESTIVIGDSEDEFDCDRLLLDDSFSSWSSSGNAFGRADTLCHFL